MKTNRTTRYSVMLLASLILILFRGKAHAQTAELYIDNDIQTSPTTYEFDIKAKSTSGSINLRTLEFGLIVNSVWLNGGTPVLSIVSSDISGTPGVISWEAAPKSDIRITANTSVNCAAPTVITTSPRTIYRVSVTNSSGFGCSPPEICFNFGDGGVFRAKTILTEWGSTCLSNIVTPAATFNGGPYVSGSSGVSGVSALAGNNKPLITTQPSNLSLCTGQSAVFSVSASAGSYPSGNTISYQWNLNGVPVSGATASSYTVSSVSAANSGEIYTVSLTAACAGTYGVTSSGATLTVNTPASAVISGALSYCAGSSTALSSNSASAYLWSPGGSTAPSISVNSPGTYTLTTTDVNGCTSTATATVVENENPSVTASSSNVINCTQPNTTISAIATASSSNTITGYAWSTGQTTADFVSSVAGTYTVTVTQSNGCTASSSVTSTADLGVPSVSASASNSISFSLPTATISASATASPSNTITSYSWNSGQTTSSFTTSIDGSYTVTVTQSNGCTASASTFVMYVTSGSVCDTLALPANFEIDANLRSGNLHPAADDWFTGASGTGIGVIGTTAATAYAGLPLSIADFKTYLQTAATPLQRNVTYAQRMTGNLAAIRTTALGSVMMLEAVAGRDHFSSTSTVDSTSFTAGRNADNPLHNWGVGSAVHSNDAEIIDAGVHYRRIVTGPTTFGDCWGYGFVTNPYGNGDAFYDFEFFQTVPVLDKSSGAVSLTGPDSTGGHTAFYTDTAGKLVRTGDVIFSLDHVNMGLSQAISVRIWVDPTNLGPGITSFAQFNAKAGRQFEFTGQFDSGLNGNGYGYAEIRPRGTPTNCVFYASVNRIPTCKIPAGGWGTIEGGSGNYKDSVGCYQFTECAINFSKFGLENVLLRLNCNTPTVSVLVKSRSSAHFSSDLRDFAGPYPMRNIVESNAGSDKQITCASSTVALSGSSATPNPTIVWTVVPGSGGNIVSGGNTFTPTVNASGKYVMAVSNILIAPCTATDTMEVTLNQTTPSVSTSSSDVITCSQLTTTVSSSATPSGSNSITGYSWSSGQTTQSFTASSSGTYTVTVTQSNSCTATSSVTVVSDLGVPSVSASSSNVLNCNQPSAVVSATATPSGSNSITGYSWSSGQTSSSFSTSGTGSYTVTVTQSNGCTASASTMVSQTVSLSASSSSGSISCYGGTTTVTVSATGGTTPYSGTGSFTVSAGSYSYTVTDADGCTSVTSGNVTEPTALSASSSAGSISCYGGTTTVTVSASGGTTPYSGTGSFTRTAGTYAFTVTDGNGCTDITSVSINQPSQLIPSASTSSDSISCYGGSREITINASGGTPPYTGTGLFVRNAGTYAFTVNDSSGCSVTVSRTLLEPSLPLSSAIYNPTKVTGCYNSTTGAAGVTATGGWNQPNYSYQWFPGGQTTQIATNLSIGTYTVTITDIKGCSTSSSVIITGPDPVNVTANSNPIACFGGSTTVTVSATGGTSPYTGTGSFTRTAGTYTFTVTDANGCTATASVTVTQPNQLTASSSAGSIACFGGSTTVTVSATGGTSPYTGTGSFTRTAGTYTFTVTDANGCTATTSVTVTQPNQLTASSSAGSIACFGSSTTVTVSATGGTSPYTGTGSFTRTAGTYTFTVTDANGCTATTSVTVTQPNQLIASSSAGSIACFGGSTTVTVSATGGTSPYTGTGSFTRTAGTYTFTVTDANGCTATTSVTVTQPNQLTASSFAGSIACFGGSTTVTVSATGGTSPYTGTGSFTRTAGTYTFTVTDANGCTATTSVTVTQPNQLIASSSAGSIACFGGSTTVTVSATGGTSPYTGTDSFTRTAGTYSFTVVDSNGCTATTSVTVTQPNQLTASSSAGSIACFGGSTTVTVSATGGTSPYTGTGSFTRTAGTYTFTVTDANGCTATTSVTVSEPAQLTASSSAGTIACFGGSTTVTVSATGGTSPYTGTVSFTRTAGTYSFTVVDSNGCTATTSVTVTQPNQLTASSSAGTIACFGGSTTVTV
ncbi:MAG: hypothetical protein RL213_823, partial [Bacteroidota bacterium]